ncbi:MAG: beta strand repeat-containing protein, partial [Steroidobacteraceae bacterium]
VFEDRNYGGGAGRSLLTAGGQPLANVRVELYRQSSGAFVDSDTTTAAGQYSLDSGNNANAATVHIVRVVNGTVRSARTAGCTTCVGVQTYRTDVSAAGSPPQPVTNRVGGETPSLSDAASNTSNANFSTLNTASQAAQSITLVDPVASGSTIDNVDFGFNFDTIVNTRDATICTASGTNSTFYPCQGSLRQFIINANNLGGEGALTQAGSGQLDGGTATLPSGFESSIFMIPSGALTSGVAAITLTAALPTVTGSSTRLDATTQTLNIGNSNGSTLGTGGSVGVDSVSLPFFQRPEVQLNCAASGTTPVTLSGSSSAIVGFALRQGYILLSGVSGTARNNLVGMTATGSSADDSSGAYGIAFSASAATIRNNFVTVNNSAIRSDGGGTGSTITLNEVARPSGGHTNTFDGILLINGASSVQIVANLVRDQRGGGIELGFGAATDAYTNVQVSNNTVQNNGFDSGSTPSTERLGMVGYNYTGSNVVFSRNRVLNNGGPGLVMLNASGTTISQNSFSSNGGVAATSGLAIDLDPNTRDPNSLGTPNGVTINDANDTDTTPNGLLNFPVITAAIVANGELSITGFARPGSAIELYIAQADPSGFGEGLTYLGTLTEGAAADLNATAGTYGPAAINGLLQGTDTTNRFAFRMSIPGGVSIGSVLTSTATLGGQTSEFGGNVTVTSGPALTHLKSVAVLSDPLNNTTNPKSIPGAMQVYTLRLTNSGSGSADNNTVAIVDAVPANTALFVQDLGVAGSGPVAFTNGAPTSALTYTFSGLGNAGDDLEFSNNSGTSWAYTPVANANGCDPAVTHIRVRPKGTMAAASGAGNPFFEVRFRVRVN